MVNGHFLNTVLLYLLKKFFLLLFVLCVDICEWKPGALCSAKAGLLLHRQHAVSRSSLTSSAGPRTSNATLMTDKHIGFGRAGQQMGTFTVCSRRRSEPSACFSGSLFQTQAAYSNDMLRGKGFLLYGKAITCQFLEWSEVQLVYKEERKTVRYGMTKADGKKQAGLTL